MSEALTSTTSVRHNVPGHSWTKQYNNDACATRKKKDRMDSLQLIIAQRVTDVTIMPRRLETLNFDTNTILRLFSNAFIA